MDDAHTEVPAEAAPSPVPWTFTCAIWVPTFAVVLWFMLRLFGPRPLVPEEEDGPDE